VIKIIQLKTTKIEYWNRMRSHGWY